MTIRVFEAFAGVGSQRMALRNLGINHEVVAIAEIDKFAIKSYEAIHGETNNLGDISQMEIEDIPDHDLFTYSFPCQDISVAGKGLGLDEGSDTRSGLLWECQKVIYGKRPKYLLLENVKNLVGKKHKHNFDKWLEWLEGKGYTNYWQVLNAKDYGVPQNRERVFVVSILGHHDPYEFPEPIELELRLKDVLEDVVDEKFYLDTDKSNKLISTVTSVMVGSKEGIPIKNATKKGYINAYDGDGVDLAYPTSKTRRGRVQMGLSQTLDTSDSKGVVIAASRGRNPENPSDRTIGSPTEQRLEINKQGTSNTITTVQKDNYVVEAKEEYGRMGRQAVETLNENDVKHSDTINPFNKRVSSKDGISPTLTTRPEGFKTAVLPVVEQDKRLAEASSPNDEIENAHFLIGSTQKNARITNGDYTTTLTSAMGTGGGHVPMHNISSDLRIRKLTPKECWLLMGFSDDDFHKAEEVNSNSQLYKQAGNSIVVDVLEGIFKQLLEE